MRSAQIDRTTGETTISLYLLLEGTGQGAVNTGCGFLNHMLTLFTRHGRFDLTVSCKGDVDVDYHHTVEDIGICLGEAFHIALGEKRGIIRYGNTILPMDETLIMTAVDISGRGSCHTSLDLPTEKVGDFDTELCEEFWQGFARSSGINLHIRQIAGSNSHHIIEGIFKSMARSLRTAVRIDPDCADDIPSTKGTLS